MNHKEGCEWKDVYFSVYKESDYGPDMQLTVTEDSIQYDTDVNRSTEDYIYIGFKFCPLCGCNLKEE
jgi:hypothetical protein